MLTVKASSLARAERISGDSPSFQWEAWPLIVDEALPLLRIYWYSGGVLFPDELPWDPDLPLSMVLHQAGRLRIYTVRIGGRLVGLNSFNVGPVLFRKRAIVAVGIILYLVPSERRGSVGFKLIKGAEEGLRELGANLICYMPAASVDISRVLRICGYTQQGACFEKLLKPQLKKVINDKREHQEVRRGDRAASEVDREDSGRSEGRHRGLPSVDQERAR